MRNRRLDPVAAITKGLLCAVAVTLGCMGIIVALVVFSGLPDNWLRGLNQSTKLLAMVSGVFITVKSKVRSGFAAGMALCIIYMALGFGMYMALGGGAFDVSVMLGEILLGAAVGGLAGALFSNLPHPGMNRRRNLSM